MAVVIRGARLGDEQRRELSAGERPRVRCAVRQSPRAEPDHPVRRHLAEARAHLLDRESLLDPAVLREGGLERHETRGEIADPRKHLGVAPHFWPRELYWSEATRHVYSNWSGLTTFP